MLLLMVEGATITVNNKEMDICLVTGVFFQIIPFFFLPVEQTSPSTEGN